MKPKADGGFSLRHMESSSVNSVVCFIRCTNLLNAALLMAGAIVSFIPVAGATFNLAMALSAIYVILFSCLLCCFEVHLKKFDRYVFLNFGFMFYWGGRLVFFFFVGSLSFGLGILGIIAGAYTIVNVLINIYVLRIHPAYRQMLMEKTKLYKSQAASHELKKIEKAEKDKGPAVPGVPGDVSLEDAQKAAAFYKDNQESVDAAAKVAYQNKETIAAAATTAHDVHKAATEV